MKRDQLPRFLGDTVKLGPVSKQVKIWRELFPHLSTEGVSSRASGDLATLVVPKRQALCACREGFFTGQITLLYTTLAKLGYVSSQERTFTGNIFLEGKVGVSVNRSYLQAMERAESNQGGDFLLLNVFAGASFEGEVYNSISLSIYEVFAALVVAEGRIPLVTDGSFLKALASGAETIGDHTSPRPGLHPVLFFDSKRKMCVLEADEELSLVHYAKYLLWKV